MPVFLGGATSPANLTAFTTADGVTAGLLGIVSTTGVWYLCTFADGSGSTWTEIGAGELPWELVYDLDFTAEANQSPVGNNLTVQGVTWYGRNLTQAGTAQIVNGTGLVIDTTGGGGAATIELFQAATNGPRFEVNLDDLYAWESTEWWSARIEAEFTFTNSGNQFSFAGIVLGWVLQSGAGLGTATTQHAQSLRGLFANIETGLLRANANGNGGESTYQRVGTGDQASEAALRCDLLGQGGVSEHYNLDLLAVNPPWNPMLGARASLNNNNSHNLNLGAPGVITTPARLRAMVYAGRAGAVGQQARIECRRFQIFRVRRQDSL